MTTENVKTPVHLWIIGIVTLLWNAMGAFDYSATQFRIDAYMSQFTAEQLEYFYGLPAWFDAFWALAVWCSLLGSISLLLRRRWAVGLFAVSVICLAVTSVYSFGMTDGMDLMGGGAIIFTAVIWVVALFLVFYARAMAKRGVLK